MSNQPAIHPELAALIAHGHNFSCRKGDIIIRPDDDTVDVFYLRSGLVKVYVIGNHGEEHIHALFRPGDFFPLVQAAIDTRLNVYFAAVTDVELVRIRKPVFTQAMTQNPLAGYEILKLMAQQYATYIARVDNLEYKFARERLAYRLLLLARKIGVQTKDGIELPHLSQYEIGSMVNLSRESVSRELSRFERLGVVSYKKSRITIIDVNALKHELGADNQMIFLNGPYSAADGQ